MLSWDRGVLGSFSHDRDAWGLSLLQSRAQLALHGWVPVGAGRGFLQVLLGLPHRRRKQSYDLGRFGEGREFLRDEETQCLNP